MPVQIPAVLRSRIAGRVPDAIGGISGDDWLAALPRLIAERMEAWGLTADGDPWYGENALVVPVTRPEGEAGALKLTWPHVEAQLEHLALRHWAGEGAVRLLAAHPATYALLLERLDGDRDLDGPPIIAACEEIGGLFGRLDRPSPPQVPSLAAHIPRWQDKLREPPPQVPRRLVLQAAHHLQDLAPGADDGRLVHTDLHFQNVLAPQDPARGQWLAIDPKPLAAEWAFAVAPAIWNRSEEAARAHSLAVHVRFRADVITDAAGLDEERVRAWTFLRLVLNAVDAADAGPSADDFRGRMIALATAFANP
ncbi:MAG: aminoglycoside phosphotransferase family protein [Brachybacterium sp.]|nr:aminoglycoside phosphotransferase family protein [Brachybacterium sp.]